MSVPLKDPPWTIRIATRKSQSAFCRRIPELDSYYSVVARGWRPTLVNHAVTWVTLKDWSERRRPQHEIVAEVQPDLSEIPRCHGLCVYPTSV